MSDDSTDTRTLLVTANSIIQRDAFQSALADTGITCHLAEHIISRKVTDVTVDISYEGYSALSDLGFAIYVAKSDLPEARKILDSVMKTFHDIDAGTVTNHIGKFNICALFSMAIPVLGHILGAYHFYRAVKLGQLKQTKLSFYVSFLIYLCTLAFTYKFIADYVGPRF